MHLTVPMTDVCQQLDNQVTEMRESDRLAQDVRMVADTEVFGFADSPGVRCYKCEKLLGVCMYSGSEDSEQKEDMDRENLAD